MKTKEEIIDRLEAILGCLIGSHTSNDTPDHQLEKLITEMKSKENDGVLDGGINCDHDYRRPSKSNKPFKCINCGKLRWQ